MKIEKKIFELVGSGFQPSTILEMNEKQINALYNRLVETKKKETKEETKTQVTNITFDPSNTTDQQKLAQKGIHVDPTSKKITMTTSASGAITEDDEELEEQLEWLTKEGNVPFKKDAEQTYSGQEEPHDASDQAPDGMDDDSDNDPEMEGQVESKQLEEKFESKAQQKYFFARCNDETLSKKERTKWCSMADEFAEKTNYKKLPERKKETKEDFGFGDYGKKLASTMAGLTKKNMNNMKSSVQWESQIEKNIMRLVEKHITPKMSKKDFVKLVKEQGTEVAPSKPTTKPTTKPSKPSTPYSPKPGPKKAPKAKTNEQAPVTAPPKPKTPTKPTTPSTPYSPKPGPKKAPKALGKDLPKELTFKQIGLNLK